MNTAQKVIAIARAEVGYREGRNANGSWNNHQKFSPAVPGLEWSQNQAWCATFLSWDALKAGVSNLFPRTASTDAAAAWFKARGQWSEYPAVGAWGFLGVGNDMHHVFLVTGLDDDFVYTIEGNTNDTGSPQGNGVYALKRRRRGPGSPVGYGYPAYPEGIESADPARARQTPAPVKKPAAKPAPKPAAKNHVTAGRALIRQGIAELRKAPKTRKAVHAAADEYAAIYKKGPSK